MNSSRPNRLIRQELGRSERFELLRQTLLSLSPGARLANLGSQFSLDFEQLLLSVVSLLTHRFQRTAGLRFDVLRRA
jgi:hypothetical protein